MMIDDDINFCYTPISVDDAQDIDQPLTTLKQLWPISCQQKEFLCQTISSSPD